MIGTTPEYRFKIPVDTSLLVNSRVVYKQRGRVILTKEFADLVMEGNMVCACLSQEETFLFDHTAPFSFQWRGRTKDGKALKSFVYEKTLTECLDKELI